MSYGSADGIAAFTPRYANASGRFDNVTVPTLGQVDEWRGQISAVLDVAMATAGLPSPASVPSVVAMLDAFVNGNIGGMVRGVNGQGKFAEKPTSADEMLLAIADAADAWVQRRAAGIAALSGVTLESEQAAVTKVGSVLPTRVMDSTYASTVSEYT